MNAILIITGFTQPEQRTSGCGLFTIRDHLADHFFDRRQTWIAIRTWNSDQLKHDAEELDRLGVEKTIVIAYSWGCGFGLWIFSERMAELDRKIDLACLIDPVIYVRGGRLISRGVQALRDGKDPFLLPENVREYASWRTVNKPTWTTPWGRDVEGAGKSILRHAYGSVENHDRYAPRGLRSIDNDVTHTSIDDHAEVHSELLSLVKQFGGGN